MASSLARASRVIGYFLVALLLVLCADWYGAWDSALCNVLYRDSASDPGGCGGRVHPQAFVLAPIAIGAAMLIMVVAVELRMRNRRDRPR